jgi:hypothetical protein
MKWEGGRKKQLVKGKGRKYKTEKGVESKRNQMEKR